MAGALRRFKDLWGWAGIIWTVLGWVGLASIVSGLAVSVGGVVWAVIVGVPIPIAIMAAFCVLVGAVYLAMAPLIFKLLNQNPNLMEQSQVAPNYAVWQKMNSYFLTDAAFLFCEIEPHSAETSRHRGWERALIDAIQSGDLDFEYADHIRRDAEAQRNGVGPITRINRDDLKKFAKRRGYNPIFLRDSSA